MASVLHKEVWYKVEKLKYNKSQLVKNNKREGKGAY